MLCLERKKKSWRIAGPSSEMAQGTSSFSGKGKHFNLQVSNASAGTLGKLFGLDPMSIVITERGDEEVALSLLPNDDGKFDVVHVKKYRVDGEERQPVPSIVEKSPSMVGPFGSYSRGPFTPARSSGRGLFQESSRTPYSRPSAASFAVIQAQSH